MLGKKRTEAAMTSSPNIDATLREKILAEPAAILDDRDLMHALIAANAYGVEDVRKVKYIAFDGGGEAVTQLLAGSARSRWS